MDNEAQEVSLTNICGGAIEEVFQREFASILANIADVNTNPEGKRKITLEFTITPFEDRSGGTVTFACKSKMIPVEEVKGTVFFQRRGLVMVAVPHDPKQQRLFEKEGPGGRPS